MHSRRFESEASLKGWEVRRETLCLISLSLPFPLSPSSSLFFWLHDCGKQEGKLRGQSATQLSAPLPFLLLMVPFPVISLVSGNLVPVGLCDPLVLLWGSANYSSHGQRPWSSLLFCLLFFGGTLGTRSMARGNGPHYPSASSTGLVTVPFGCFFLGFYFWLMMRKA